MGNNASFQSAKEDREPSVPGRYPIVDTTNANGWDNVTGESSHSGWAVSGSSTGVNHQGWLEKTIKAQHKHNGWGERATKSQDYSGKRFSGDSARIKDQGWLDKSTETQHKGWGERTSGSDKNSDKCSSDKPRHQEVSSKGWMDEPAKEEYNGWISGPAKQEFNGWLDEPVKDEHNGWSLPQDSLPNNPTKEDTQKVDDGGDQSENPTSVPPAPSAPPLPEEDIYEGIAHYPCVGSSPIDVPGPCVERYPLIDSSPVDGVPGHETMHEAWARSEGRKERNMCIICWDAAIEGACVPCGHMAGCVECLNQIKSKAGDCPVCRAKIEQVIRLYGV